MAQKTRSSWAVAPQDTEAMRVQRELLESAVQAECRELASKLSLTKDRVRSEGVKVDHRKGRLDSMRTGTMFLDGGSWKNRVMGAL
eukprot:6482166-Amphidinium_carterae.1